MALRHTGHVATSAIGLPLLRDNLMRNISLSALVAQNSFPYFRLLSYSLTFPKVNRI